MEYNSPSAIFLQFLVQHAYILWLILAIIIIWLCHIFTNIIGHWHHTFDNANFSALECYEMVEAGIKEREIPGLRIKRTKYRERFVFGARREYLRIIRGDYVFDICVSPFGTGMFASWWFVTETNRFTRIIRNLPTVSFFFSRITYHQIDSELMFEDLVHQIFLEVLDAMTDEHGTRMNEYERRIQDPSRYNTKRR